MKIFKNLLMSVAVCSMLIACVACSGGNDHGLNPGSPTPVTIWHYYNGALGSTFDEMVTDFNNTLGKEKGIVVSAKSKGSIAGVEEAIRASIDGEIGAEALPQIFSVYSDTAYSVKDKIADLSNYLTASQIKEFVPSYIEEGGFEKEGEIKMFPIAKSTEVLAINKTDWDKFSEKTGADVKKFATWEGITELSEQYYAWSGGKAFFGRDAFANYMLVGSKQLGKPVFEVENGQVNFQLDSEVMRKLWDNYYVPYVKGWFKHGGKFRTDDIKSGAIVACVGSTSGVTYFPENVDNNKDPEYAIQGMILPLPNFAGTEKYAVQQGAGMAVVHSDEKTEYASTVFLRWFSEKDNNLKYSLGSGYLPVKKDLNTEEAAKEYFTDNTEISALMKSTLYTGIEIVNNYTLYTTLPFDCGTEAREIVNTSMIDKAVEDFAAIENGKVTLQQCLTVGHFEEWLKALGASLENLKDNG